jgi:hypothetical protein
MDATQQLLNSNSTSRQGVGSQFNNATVAELNVNMPTAPKRKESIANIRQGNDLDQHS